MDIMEYYRTEAYLKRIRRNPRIAKMLDEAEERMIWANRHSQTERCPNCLKEKRIKHFNYTEYDTMPKRGVCILCYHEAYYEKIQQEGYDYLVMSQPNELAIDRIIRAVSLSRKTIKSTPVLIERFKEELLLKKVIKTVKILHKYGSKKVSKAV